MSASKAAELIVHHTQAASYHQGREAAYAEAMRLIRSERQRLETETASGVSLPARNALYNLEETLYHLAQEEGKKKDIRNRITREASEMLSANS
jgi:hypothetical protein